MSEAYGPLPCQRCIGHGKLIADDGRFVPCPECELRAGRDKNLRILLLLAARVAVLQDEVERLLRGDEQRVADLTRHIRRADAAEERVQELEQRLGRAGR